MWLGKLEGLSGRNGGLLITDSSRRGLTVLLWIAGAVAVVIMARSGPAGWDARIYEKADQFLRHGVDPYAAGIAEQEAFRDRLAASHLPSHLPSNQPGSSQPASSEAEHAPFTYVYSPLTLPLLRLLVLLPDGLLNLFFWVAIAAGFFLEVWAGFQLASDDERPWLALMLPAVAFFPGLVTDDVILSGNLAYILYGLILAAAVPGWKRGRWFWFYAAVLAASIFKAQLLTLLAFPVLVGKRQWVPAAGTAAAGLLLIAAEARLWPDLFREYLTTIRIMFDVVPDFGYGPAGFVGRTLWLKGRPYSSATTITYVAFAGAVGIMLLLLARRAKQKLSFESTREVWIPVALVGTFLLNPRIMKYDLAAITIPMLLIGWRALRHALQRRSRTEPVAKPEQEHSTLAVILVGAGCFLVPNLMTVAGPAWWPVELAVLLVIFTTGIWSLEQAQDRGYKLELRRHSETNY